VRLNDGPPRSRPRECKCSPTVKADTCCHQTDTYDLCQGTFSLRTVSLPVTSRPGIRAHLEQDPLVLGLRVDALRLEEVCLGAHLVRRVQVVLICDAGNTMTEWRMAELR